MVIKKYRARDVEEAKQIIFKELGPKAEILTVQHVKPKGILSLFLARKIDVTVAIDEQDLKEHTQNQFKVRVSPDTTKGRRESRERSPSQLDRNLKGLQDSLKEKGSIDFTSGISDAPARKGGREQTYGNPRLRMTPQPERAIKRMEYEKVEDLKGLSSANKGLISAFKHVLKEEKPQTEKPQAEKQPETETMRQVIREEIQNAQKSVEQHLVQEEKEEAIGSAKFLLEKGVSSSIAFAIQQKLEKKFGKVDLKTPSDKRTNWMNELKKELTQGVKVSGPILLNSTKPTVVAIVGPTGIGKTTTLMKIAAQYSGELKKKVGIISLDTTKVGATDQIKKLASQFQIPLEIARNGDEFRGALNAFSDQQLILVDTAGRSQYHWEQIDELAEILSRADSIKIILAVSAATKDVDAIGTVQEFSRLEIDSLIFTKLDETVAHGMILNVCQKTNCSVRYLTYGQKVPDDLKIADAQEIARTLLVKHNSLHFQTLRKLANY